MRAADYDDWVTPTISKNGHLFHGLNGDILVWNSVTKRRHELSSMGIRVNDEIITKNGGHFGKNRVKKLAILWRSSAESADACCFMMPLSMVF